MNVTINNKVYKFEEEMTVLAACRAVGIEIPTLCQDDVTGNHGHCRLCVVEVNGKLQLACETSISDGMLVNTNSELIQEARKLVLSLLIKEHNFDCPVCDKSGQCAFQEVATQYDVQTSDNFVCEQPSEYVEFSDTLLYDESKCIKCGRCIRRISDSTAPSPAAFRKYGLSPNKPYKASDIVEACPTAALREK